MIPKEFMSTEMAHELSTLIQRVNDLHVRLQVLGRLVEQQRLETERLRKAIHVRRAQPVRRSSPPPAIEERH
jgi:hypothetical protein